ncbi:unnamed protein product [Rotaria sordida]|uniref:JmjC domain-containing protein n=1 Tax=Rotaria sordida TaxID=392033 RepID=A0A819WBN1_9BILA|nr:unnamed protein product [Rotaria sordida]CAF4015612.1 unnamed protein product [Rotaria sordida]CAF4120556.1 unnamed protein product [Rotaria sordida]
MTSTIMDVPTLQIDANGLQNLIRFIYKHESLLKQFGTFKIRPHIDCKLALKKRQKNLVLPPITKQITKMDANEHIYFVKDLNSTNESSQNCSIVTDECSFWSSLYCSSQKQQSLNISLSCNTSFFSEKTARSLFDLHRLPNQSLLQLTKAHVRRQIVPCVRRAHGPGAIFPFSCVKQRLFSIDYHHEGGDHYWYMIPNCERELLQKVLNETNSSICLDHGQIFIDPFILEKYCIRYYRLTQHPGEFVVLSAGTLSQSFTKDASWSESIPFALPSWIEDGHAAIPLCQCDVSHHSSVETIDITQFTEERIQKYVHIYLNINNDNKLITLKDHHDMNVITKPTSDNIENNSSNVEMMTSTNMEVIDSFQPTTSSLTISPISLLPSLFNSSAILEKDNRNIDDTNIPVQYKVLEEGIFPDKSGWNVSEATLINFISSGHQLASNMQTNQRHQITSTSTNIQQNVMHNCNMANRFPSIEELLDLVPNMADDTTSIYGYSHESNYSVSNDKKSLINE